MEKDPTNISRDTAESAPQLDLSPADLQNLVAVTDLAGIFLDHELRIKRFTPSAGRIFNLTVADIGRSLSEVTDRLSDKRIVHDAEKVLQELTSLEREFRLGQERWFMARLAPYRTEDDRIGGVVAASIEITERKRAEEELRALSERMERQLHKFTTVMTAVPDFIYHFDLEGRFTYMNQPLLDLWGKSYEEAVGKNFYELDYPPELAARLQRQIQEVIETRQPLKDETPYTSGKGERQYEYIFVPLLNSDGKVEAVAGTTRDITERKETEQALRTSQERFRLLVEGARDYAMFLLELDNTITYWNAGAERIFGWSAQEAVGQSGELIFTPEDRAREEEEKEMATALRDGRAPDRRYHMRKDGSRFWVDGVMMRIDDEHGAARGFAKVARDATDQKAVEEALRQARDEMEQAVVERTRDLLATNRELERTMSQRQQLEKELLEISEREKRRIGEDLHDMVCQELTATAFFLKTSAKKVAEESPTAQKSLEEAAQIVNRNVGLTRDLARGLQPADLTGSTLKQALNAYAQHTCENTGINCMVKSTRGLRLTDNTITLHLYRVAQEALKNAVKHSGAKNILIHIDHTKTHVCVSVQDDGKGFSPKRRSKGLGLHIMRYRANALGGELLVQRRKRGGMDITCKVPITK